jgi:hypothetical protein
VLAGFFGAGERHGRAKFERPARRHTEQGLTFRAGGVPAVALIAGGIGFQIWALAKMLSMASLELRTHRRIVRIFLIGLFLVSLGVLLAIGGDAFNYSRKLFKPA